MFCSTIIPTIGRGSLSQTVQSVLNQALGNDDFEVIVVNDSGLPLQTTDWQKSPRVRVINTHRRNRSVARNVGASIANGQYLHFIDDDDWILPGTFESFWQLSRRSEAAWLHGAFRLVTNDGSFIAEICPDEIGNCYMQLVAWEWLPLQASLIKAHEFFRVGGFASLQSLSGGFEDIDLSRKIARYYEMDCIPKVVASIRAGRVGSTTDYSGMFRQNRLSREKALGVDGAFDRLYNSAEDNSSRSSYWYGKLVYYYLSSAKWNLKRRKLYTAFNRITYSFMSLITAGRHTFSKSFWLGCCEPHYSRVWLAAEKATSNPYADIDFD